MNQQIEIKQFNQQTLVAGTQAQVQVDAGIYDLQGSGIRFLSTNGAVTADSTIYYRKDYALGFTNCTIEIDNEIRFVVQNLSATQQLFYYNRDFEKVSGSVIATVSGAENISALMQFYGTDAATSGYMFYKFEKFFPGFSERYLVVKNSMIITLTLGSLTGMLIQKASGGARTAINSTGLSPLLIMKQVHGLDPKLLIGMKKSYIEGRTKLAKEIQNQTFEIKNNELSQYSGFLIQDDNQTSIQNGFLTAANLTAATITKNDYEIIVATSYDYAIQQANALKNYQDGDPNVLSGLLYHDTTDENIDYEVQITGAANSQITFVCQKLK